MLHSLRTLWHQAADALADIAASALDIATALAAAVFLMPLPLALLAVTAGVAGGAAFYTRTDR